MRPRLATFVLVLLLASSYASAATMWRMDDERREIAPNSLGSGLRVAEGAADLVSFTYGWRADDLVIVFELADADARMYTDEESPDGENLYMWADVGNIGVVAIRFADGGTGGAATYWYGEWEDATFVYPTGTRVALDAQLNTVEIVLPAIRQEVTERDAFWHGLGAAVHDFACFGDDCSEVQQLTRTYADQLHATNVYAESGSCRIIAIACVDTMGLDVGRPDL